MALATVDDVATRLGRALTEAEQEFVEQVIETVTGQIADEVDRDADWAADLDLVPFMLRELCIGKAIIVGSNPSGLASESETLGAHSHSRTFQRSNDSGVFLTETEKRAVRLAVYGTNSGSSSPRSMTDRLIDLHENRDVDEVEA